MEFSPLYSETNAELDLINSTKQEVTNIEVKPVKQGNDLVLVRVEQKDRVVVSNIKIQYKETRQIKKYEVLTSIIFNSDEEAIQQKFKIYENDMNAKLSLYIITFEEFSRLTKVGDLKMLNNLQNLLKRQ